MWGSRRGVKVRVDYFQELWAKYDMNNKNH